jgi:phage terminase large subunit
MNIEFSPKYQPLLAKPYAREKVNSKDFHKLSEKEQEFWTKLDKVDIFVLTGGRGSGKSFVVEADAHMRGHLGHHTYYTRYTNDSLESTVKADFDKIMEMMPLNCQFQKNQIIYEKGLIYFKGLKRGSKSQTAGGKGLSSFNVQIVEEAEEHPSFQEFDKMRLSLRRNELANYSILLLNPTTYEHWIYKKFFEEKNVKAGSNTIVDNVCYIHTTYLDVDKKHHTFENWDSYEKGRIAYEKYEAFTQIEKDNNQDRELHSLWKWYKFTVLGGWRTVQEGAIFTNWGIGEFDTSLPFIFGQDFGSSSPSTLVKVAIDKKNKKLYAKECFYKKNMNINQIFEENLYFADKKTIIADSAAKSTIITLQNMKNPQGKYINVEPCRKWQGSVLDTILRLQSYEIIVDKDSTNLIIELNNYVWIQDKETPLDDFNHLIDPIRYCLVYLEN